MSASLIPEEWDINDSQETRSPSQGEGVLAWPSHLLPLPQELLSKAHIDASTGQVIICKQCMHSRPFRKEIFSSQKHN